MSDAESCRIDVWLWRARFYKSRGLAAKAVEAGGFRLTREPLRAALEKPSRLVRPGDVLVFPMGARWRAIRVLTLGERRGPAAEARELYETVGGSAIRDFVGEGLRSPLAST